MSRLTGQTLLPTATATYYHQDGLGSVLATTNAAKTVTATQRFDAFGLKLAGATTVSSPPEPSPRSRPQASRSVSQAV